MAKLLRIQIRNSDTGDTHRAVEVWNNGEREINRDYGTIGEAARDNLDRGVKIYRGKRLITRDLAESGDIG